MKSHDTETLSHYYFACVVCGPWVFVVIGTSVQHFVGNAMKVKTIKMSGINIILSRESSIRNGCKEDEFCAGNISSESQYSS